MANPEHVAKLKEGVEAWNKWWIEIGKVRPDLSDADLRDADLSGAYLINADLSDADLSRADLRDADLRDADLREADLREADLSRADLSRADLIRAKLSEAKLSKAKLSRAKLSKADLSGADLSEAKLRDADLSRAKLSKADLSDANLRGADLCGANLLEATLFKADLSGADLRDADLSRTILFETVIADVDLTSTKRLEEIYHRAPSTIDHRTLARSGELPGVFLRGFGLQDWQIENAKLLQPGLSNAEINDIIYRVYDLRAHQAIQISPLFISYSHANTPFVDAIEKKLIDKGIRFWRDINDMNAGKMEKQVDRAMRLNDTVLIVLSEKSVNSDWVEHEATKARKLENSKKNEAKTSSALLPLMIRGRLVTGMSGSSSRLKSTASWTFQIGRTRRYSAASFQSYLTASISSINKTAVPPSYTPRPGPNRLLFTAAEFSNHRKFPLSISNKLRFRNAIKLIAFTRMRRDGARCVTIHVLRHSFSILMLRKSVLTQQLRKNSVPL